MTKQFRRENCQGARCTLPLPIVISVRIISGNLPHKHINTYSALPKRHGPWSKFEGLSTRSKEVLPTVTSKYRFVFDFGFLVCVSDH